MLKMTDEQVKQKVLDIQTAIDEVKEQIRTGKLERYLYFSSLTGIFEAHLLDILGYNFDTELN